ncbi:MAG TPA: glycosyltransferase [Steroidobacteraceae bacterium]|nr:glycosyltransferase [Steroidobacteraceae bacterium]
MQPLLTIITPTTGRRSLLRLIESVRSQDAGVAVVHLLLWDDKREPGGPTPAQLEAPDRMNIVLPKGFGRFGHAPGSALRSIGLIWATTDWVTFADDDVWWDRSHVRVMLEAAAGHNWASTLRRVWSPAGAVLGVDRFESVGDDPQRRVSYEMCDNNCMMVQRSFGVAAAPLYRETRHYNDDRLMYAFLKRDAGPRGRTGTPTINQVCPERLIEFFRLNCSPS